MDNRYPRTPLPPTPTRPSQGSIPAVPSLRPPTLLSPAPAVPSYGPQPATATATATATMTGYASNGYGPPSGYGANPHGYGYPAPSGYGPPPSTGAQPPAPMPQNAYAGHAQGYGPPPNAQPASTYGSLPPLGWQAAASPPLSRGRGSLASMPGAQKSGASTAVLIGGAAAAAVSVLAIVGGAWAVFRTSHKPLPVEAAKLPTDTDFFQEDRFPGADGPPAVRDAFLASDLARHVCGAGSDFADRLMRLKTGGSPGDALALFDPKTIEGRRASLQCGQSLLGSLATPSFTELVFHDGDEKTFSSVEMLKLRVDELPTKFGFAKQSFAGFSGFCLVSPKKTEPDFKWSGSSAASAASAGKKETKDGECGDASLSAFHEGPTWFFGSKTAIDAFARAYSKPKKELSTTVENLQLAFDSGEGLAVRRADARPKASSSLLKLPCSVAAFDSGAGSKFVEECMPKSVEKNVSSIDSKVRAVTYELAAPIHEADGIRFNLFFVARDNDAAKDVESELKDATRDWKSAVENDEGKLSKLVREAPRQIGQRKWAVALDPFVRAIRGAKVARNGRVVELRLAEKFSASEKKEMSEVMGKTSEDSQAVAAITQAMVKGQPVPEASLAELVGAEWASHVLAPRATEKDCALLRDKMGRFDMSRTGGAIIPASMRFALRFKCEGHPIPQATQKCLTDAIDAAAFGKCPMPVDPSAAKLPSALDLEVKAPATKTVLQ